MKRYGALPITIGIDGSLLKPSGEPMLDKKGLPTEVSSTGAVLNYEGKPVVDATGLNLYLKCASKNRGFQR